MENSSSEQDLKQALQAAQIWWQDMGVDTPPAPPAVRAAKTPPAPPQAAAAAEPTGDEQILKAQTLAKSAPTLEALKAVLEDFDAGILSDNAQNLVFARGNEKASIMAIGEAPGAEEDRSGLPFVGPAGQLLDKMFASIGLDETGLYITNVCNWRPPGNRNPTEAELALCAPFITRHIELIAPKLIVIVGGVSLQALTGKTGIMKTRGQWQSLEIGGQTIPAMPLYHPAFLLRRPELKKQAWRDLLAIKQKRL